MGDARLSLEQTDRKWGFMLVDAFSSDSIPAHLLTREAIELYFDRLDDDGLLALHISNRYLKLEPVVDRIVRELGCRGARACSDSTLYDSDCRRTGTSPSFGQVLVHVGRRRAAPGSPDAFMNDPAEPLDRDPRVGLDELHHARPVGCGGLWTDDYTADLQGTLVEPRRELALQWRPGGTWVSAERHVLAPSLRVAASR